MVLLLMLLLLLRVVAVLLGVGPHSMSWPQRHHCLSWVSEAMQQAGIGKAKVAPLANKGVLQWHVDVLWIHFVLGMVCWCWHLFWYCDRWIGLWGFCA